MSLARVVKLLGKDLRMGPRSPIFLYAIILPLAATFLLNVVFGTLLDPKPRLAVVDEGESRISKKATRLDGIQVTLLDSTSELRSAVEAGDYDAGLVLQPDFDRALMSGERPELKLFISGESLASNRIIVAVTTIDLIRETAGSAPPIDVNVKTVGGAEAVPITKRLLPLLIMFAVLVAAVFVPASGLVEEKEARTLDAVLVTPAQMPDILIAKGALGFILAILTGVVTLVINNAFGANPGALLLILALAALMCSEIGLVIGSWAKDSNTLFTAAKGGNFFLMLPVIFFIWPSLPQWIGRIFPTYYFLGPLYEVAINDASLAAVGVDLAIGFAICVAILPVVLAFGRSLEAKLATG